MFIFRCIVSSLLALGGAVLFFLGTYDDSLPLWIAAAIVLPYDAANKVVCGFATFCGAVGVYRLFCSDYGIAIMSITMAAIIWIKRIRLIIENKRLLHFNYNSVNFGSHSSRYSGSGTYSSGSGTYSSGSGTYSSSSGTYSCDDSATDDYSERRRAQYEEEERQRRQREEEYRRERLEEDRRRTQEAFEAENRRLEAEKLSQQRYGCSANIASNWDKDIRNRL